jgi:hypothetical protein
VTWCTGPACHIGTGSVSIIKAVTGDPVTDCAAEWRPETGTDASPLVAYDNGHGGTEVVAAGTAAQPGWTKLDPGISQDQTLIRIDALNDSIDGLASDCLQPTAARAGSSRSPRRWGWCRRRSAVGWPI